MILKKKLNSRGFGHFEVLLVVIVIVAVAAAGYFVYQNHKKNDVAHAGSWSAIGVVTSKNPFSSVTRYGDCQAGPTGTKTATVGGLLVANKSSQTNNYAGDGLQLIDYSGPNSTGTLITRSPIVTNWQDGEVQTSINLSYSTKNYVSFEVYSQKGSTVSNNSIRTIDISSAECTKL